MLRWTRKRIRGGLKCLPGILMPLLGWGSGGWDRRLSQGGKSLSRGNPSGEQVSVFRRRTHNTLKKPDVWAEGAGHEAVDLVTRTGEVLSGSPEAKGYQFAPGRGGENIENQIQGPKCCLAGVPTENVCSSCFGEAPHDHVHFLKVPEELYVRGTCPRNSPLCGNPFRALMSHRRYPTIDCFRPP